MLKNATGQSIDSVDSWPRPKRDYQWQPERSAMELARSWFRGGSLGCPSELTTLLQSHDLTRNCTLLTGQPEFVTALPERGEGRNHDLWLKGMCAGGGLTVCVEAKADEPFGQRAGEAIDAARQQTSRTGVPARAKALLEILLGRPVDPESDPWRDLRYQLVTAVAGTAIQAAADGSPIAVFVVQEFCGSRSDAALQRQNDADLSAFLRTVFPNMGNLEMGSLSGPMTLNTGPNLSRDVDLLIGKIRCQISAT